LKDWLAALAGFIHYTMEVPLPRWLEEKIRLASLEPMSNLRPEIERNFRSLSADEALVAEALRLLETWLSVPLYSAQAKAILAHVEHGQFALLLDSFYQLVPFGTGGRRGRVGFGPNRINPVTVSLSVQGHCNFLRETRAIDRSRRIVVAFDTRQFTDIAGTYSFLGSDNPLLGLTSRDLARMACEIYAANGFEVFVAGLNSEREYLSTPELSFAIRHLGAAGGMNVSASHNHPDDNGFKFFNPQGAQDVPPTDQEMASFMNGVSDLRQMPFETALREGAICPLPEGLHQAYLETNLALRRRPTFPLTVVYTPLCGVGDTSVGDVLRAAGYDVHVYAEHNTFDGSFSSVPLRLPNPEVPAAASPALPFASERNADLVLSSDPDADRLGVYARDAQGGWRYLSGNEIAALLAYYLCLDAELGPRRKGLLIKTMVTTRTLTRIAERAGCQIVGNLLVGFKYIAHVLDSLERAGRFENVHAAPSDLILAGEESHGVLLTPEIRDKDAAGGALILCELVSQLRARGRLLTDYLDALELECGNHQNAARNIVMKGIRGAALLAKMMQSLRDEPPAELGGFPVLRFRDLLSSEYGPLRTETERLSRNFLVYELETAHVVVRPSGTEPKAKIYVDLEGARLPGAAARDRAAAAEAARKLAAAVASLCLLRAGYHLSESAALLPDHIDLDLKAAFDTSFRADLIANASFLNSLAREEQMTWLRRRLAPYGAGSDPLQSAGSAVAHLVQTLIAEGVDLRGFLPGFAP
jgi:phosphoglucomutase